MVYLSRKRKVQNKVRRNDWREWKTESCTEIKARSKWFSSKAYWISEMRLREKFACDGIVATGLQSQRFQLSAHDGGPFSSMKSAHVSVHGCMSLHQLQNTQRFYKKKRLKFTTLLSYFVQIQKKRKLLVVKLRQMWKTQTLTVASTASSHRVQLWKTC